MLTISQIEKIQHTVGWDDENISRIFAALADKNRFRIFKLLAQHNDLCVTDIANIMGVTIAATSQQLKILEVAGLVKKERIGQMTCYELSHDNKIALSLIKLLNEHNKKK